MTIPFFSFEQRNIDIKKDTLAAFEAFFDSQWYVLGKGTTKFEHDYALFNKTKYCIGISNGLDALHLSLLAIGVGPGDEVIVPSNTYIATVLAVTNTGATPVFVEPRWETCNINPELIESKITNKTKAIMPVHLYGQSCEMDAIMAIANNYNLYVVEDNAQAHGASFNGKLTGSFGHLNATSFYPTKNIGAVGEAGAVTTDSEDLAEKIKVLRNYGSQKTYYNEVIGYNNRIDEFEAIFLSMSLNYFDKWAKERMSIDMYYRERLMHIPEITINSIAKGATNVNHLFTIRTERRTDLEAYLSSKGIGTKIHYPVPPHLQACYAHLGYNEGDFPIAEKIAKETLSLPNYIGLQPEKIDYISSQIKDFFICD
jgi:dTDP-4-amino-4,6-dideoxygalactose transaminase